MKPKTDKRFGFFYEIDFFQEIKIARNPINIRKLTGINFVKSKL